MTIGVDDQHEMSRLDVVEGPDERNVEAVAFQTDLEQIPQLDAYLLEPGEIQIELKVAEAVQLQDLGV